MHCSPRLFFLSPYLFRCRDDPLPQDGPCLPAGRCPWELVAELLRGSPVVVSLWLQAQVLVAICVGTVTTPSSWSPPWVCGPVAVCTGTTATHRDVTSPGDRMLLSPGALCSQAAVSGGPSPPCPALLPACGLCRAAAAAPGSGGQLRPRPALPCSSWGRRAAAQRRADGGRGWALLRAGAWLLSLVAAPPGWGRLSHPTCAARQRQEAGQDAWGGTSGVGARCSPAPAACPLRSGAGTVPWGVERPPLRATSVGIAGLVLVGSELALHHRGVWGPAASVAILSGMQEAGSRSGGSRRPAALCWLPVLWVQLCLTGLLWPWGLVPPRYSCANKPRFLAALDVPSHGTDGRSRSVTLQTW